MQVTLRPASAVVQPGEAAQFSLAFAPLVGGGYTCERFQFSTPAGPAFQVAVRGRGLGPVITLYGRLEPTVEGGFAYPPSPPRPCPGPDNRSRQDAATVDTKPTPFGALADEAAAAAAAAAAGAGGVRSPHTIQFGDVALGQSVT